MKIKRDSEKFGNKESNKIIKKSELNYGQYAICTFIVLALLISCFSGIFFQ